MISIGLISLYIGFAVLATLANILIQRFIISFGEGVGTLLLAIFLGTLVGLVLKFFLDKKWIFKDLDRNISRTRKKFFQYTVVGIGTTTFFWVTEVSFWLIWKSDTMRELGALLGLSIGYTAKYFLDRKYVFSSIKRG